MTPNRTLPAEPNDVERYQRLRILGCAPMGSPLLDKGLVMRFTSLDDFLDADIKAHPHRGEAMRPLEPSGQTKAVPEVITAGPSSLDGLLEEVAEIRRRNDTAPSGGMPEPKIIQIELVGGSIDVVRKDDYDTLRRHVEQLALEVGELRTYKACTELALGQIYRMFDPPLIGTVGVKVEIVKLRDRATLAESRLMAAEKGWIAVSERLPDIEVVVMTSRKSGYDGRPIYAFGARVDEGDGWLWGISDQRNGFDPGQDAAGNDIEVDDDYQVTHWLPFPRRPVASERRGDEIGSNYGW